MNEQWQTAVRNFAKAILHGDDTHKEWLTEAADAFVRGEKLPAPRSERRPKAFLDWAVKMFGSVALDRDERLDRFLEEAIELAHAEEVGRAHLDRIIERVYRRPAGQTQKEIGQAQACLETFAESIGLSSDAEAAWEFERVKTIPREEWQKRHAAKIAVGIAR